MHAVFTQTGEIFVRKTRDERPVKIACQAHARQLIAEMRTPSPPEETSQYCEDEGAASSTVLQTSSADIETAEPAAEQAASPSSDLTAPLPLARDAGKPRPRPDPVPVELPTGPSHVTAAGPAGPRALCAARPSTAPAPDRAADLNARKSAQVVLDPPLPPSASARRRLTAPKRTHVSKSAPCELPVDIASECENIPAQCVGRATLPTFDRDLDLRTMRETVQSAFDELGKDLKKN